MPEGGETKATDWSSNLFRRGFRLHAGKAQLLAKCLYLVGFSVNGGGVRPNPAKGTFDILNYLWSGLMNMSSPVTELNVASEHSFAVLPLS